MAFAKKEDFTQEIIDLADAAKALSHPARIQILKILSDMDVCMCGDIVGLLPLAQSTVSQHLKELKRVGLIQGDIDGPKVCYCVNSTVVFKVLSQIQNLLNQLSNGSNKSCNN